MTASFIKPLIIAHRGASAYAPENTPAAFAAAIEAGAEGIEFDVRLARDGVPMVFHDMKLQRIAAKNKIVSDLTSTELGKLDAGSWFNAKNPKKAAERFAAETVPTLARVFDLLNDYTGRVYVELKHTAEETARLVGAVSAVFEKKEKPPNIIVKSFDLHALRHVREVIPAVRTAALFAPKFSSVLHKEKHLIEKARECGADEISMHYSLATQNFVAKASAQNFSTVIWTVNSLVWVRRAAELGVDAVITNNPAKLLAQKRKLFGG